MSPIDQQEQEEAIEGQGGPSADARPRTFATALWRQSHCAITSAYQRYCENPERGQDDLYRAVIDFANRMLYRMELDFRGRGSAWTADDSVQRIVMKIWRGLPRMPDRTPEEFFNWLCLLCQKELKGTAKALRAELSRKVPLWVNGEEGMTENPAVLRFLAGDPGCRTSDDPLKGSLIPTQVVDREFSIPDWVQGTDLVTCCLIQDGNTYAKVARLLGTTEDAIAQRMSRLGKKAKKRTQK